MRVGGQVISTPCVPGFAPSLTPTPVSPTSNSIPFILPPHYQHPGRTVPQRGNACRLCKKGPVTEQHCVGVWRDLAQGVQAQQKKGQGACPLPQSRALQLHPLHAPKAAVTKHKMGSRARASPNHSYCFLS